MQEGIFDKNDRKTIESLGLNCIFIDNSNKDKMLKDLSYIDIEGTFLRYNKKVLHSNLFNKEILEGAGIYYGNDMLPLVITDPTYFDPEVYVSIIKKYKAKGLILDATMATFLKKPSVDRQVLKDLNFIKKIPFLKLFYLQPQKERILTEFWDIDDFTPLENLKDLEYLYLPVNELFIDIDFSTFLYLKEVDLQFHENNKTIFQCRNIESISTRYYESDLTLVQNWPKLKKFGAYFDKLKNLDGLQTFKYLQELKGEFTSKFQGFKEAKSKSIKTFFYYTEARKTPTTLEGISGLENVEVLAFSGLKKLETIADLPHCKHLKELRLEESNIPEDIEKILEIKNLKKLVVDYGQKIAKKHPKLKSLIFHEEEE